MDELEWRKGIENPTAVESVTRDSAEIEEISPLTQEAFLKEIEKESDKNGLTSAVDHLLAPTATRNSSEENIIDPLEVTLYEDSVSDSTSTTPDKLKQHEETHEKSIEIDQEGEVKLISESKKQTKFSCAKCGEHFPDAKCLEMHEFTSCGQIERQFSCQKCKMKFDSEEELKKHEKTHENDREKHRTK